MTVKELIEKLSQLNPDHRVVVRGYEGGVNDVDGIGEVKLRLDANAGVWYYGQHEIDDDGDTPAYHLVGAP